MVMQCFGAFWEINEDTTEFAGRNLPSSKPRGKRTKLSTTFAHGTTQNMLRHHFLRNPSPKYLEPR